MSGAWKLRDKESFPSMKEEFDSISNSSSNEKSKYSSNVIIVDDNGSREKSEENEIVFSIKRIDSSLNEHRMQ